MKRLRLILILLTITTGCAKKAVNTPFALDITQTGTKNTPGSDTISYLALGDSYTAGVDLDLHATYPYQLDSVLNARSFHVLSPFEVAKPGWTTDALIDAVSQKYL